MRSPTEAYSKQRYTAAERGIEFLLSFDDWWEIWAPHWDKRGKCSGCYVMARNGDTGPYAAGNVSIITMAENLAQRTVVRGSSQPNAKLSEHDIPRIRDMLITKVPQRAIAKWFSVSQAVISAIATGMTWSHA